ncbi:lipoprotein insertase outer membrane protein LolB [Congregibacter sp.]|uniref:lipoprotein insertase outer membrane protein LolB n=1 Tax=Congregibacter sp. TaxID=2744308 RepID=UPI003F6B3D56
MTALGQAQVFFGQDQRRYNRRPAAWAVLGLLLTVLSACTIAPPIPTTPAPPPPQAPVLNEQERWAERLTVITAMNEWRARGKVAYRMPQDAGSASLDWRQLGEQSKLRLSGPLGVGSTEIRNDGALLRVSRDGIERLYPADAAPWLSGDALLPVPVASIQHWLRGVPDPALPVTVLETNEGLASRIEQNGWIIRYDEYRAEQGLATPTRLNLSESESGLTLKVILREWEF